MSRTSLGIGSGLGSSPGSGLSDATILSPEGGAPPGETIYSTIVFAIYCGQHEKIALTHTLVQDKLMAVWLPFVVHSKTDGLEKSAIEGIKVVLNKQDNEFNPKLKQDIDIKFRDLIRLQIGHYFDVKVNDFVHRHSYLVKINEIRDYKCCEDTKRLHWYLLDDAISGRIDKIWSPEVQMLANECKTENEISFEEFGKTYFTDLVPDSKPDKWTEDQELIQSVDITREVAFNISIDYSKHCFPSMTMTIHSFRDYLLRHDFECDDRNSQMIFNCLDDRRLGYIRFSQLLVGLAIIDPDSPNTELRLKYVYKFYDTDNDGYLNQSELKGLLQDLSPNSKEDITKKTQELLKTLKASNNGLSFDQFYNGLSSDKLKGTKGLVRSPKSVLKSFKTSKSRESPQLDKQKEVDKPVITKEKGLCTQHRPKKYETAQHSVDLGTTGRCVDSRLWAEPGDKSYDTQKPSVSRVYSVEYTFNKSFSAAGLIDMIRAFDLTKSTLPDGKGFYSEERELLIEHLKQICITLEQILKAEDKMLRISSPAIVIGDIFGNLTDLMTRETQLWQSFPLISANYVFLGNYVNFGKWSVECVLYLFCLKVLSPNKIFLLRGRHEVRDIQIQNTFQRECTQKYGDSYGQQIWQLINKMFDRLPVALVIDESVFCTHSGIPQKMPDLLLFNTKVNNELKNPSVDSSLVWQLMTNEFSEQSLKTKTGFSESKGISRFVFDELAVKEFLKQHDFDFIICGNRVRPLGYGLFCTTNLVPTSAKFITVFSNSHFKKTNNKSAAVSLFDGVIRILLLETREESKVVSPSDGPKVLK